MSGDVDRLPLADTADTSQVPRTGQGAGPTMDRPFRIAPHVAAATMRRADVLRLQRTVGNGAVSDLLTRTGRGIAGRSSEPEPRAAVQRHNPAGGDPSTGVKAAEGAMGGGAPGATPEAPPAAATPPPAATGGAAPPPPPPGGGAAPGPAPGGGTSAGPAPAAPLPANAVDPTAAFKIVSASFGGVKPITNYEIRALPLADIQAAYARDCNERGAKIKNADGTTRDWTTADASGIGGFADDRNGKIYVSLTLSVLGHVHELLHMNTAGGFRALVGDSVNEGMTDHLAVKAVRAMGLTQGSPGYVKEMGYVSKLIESVGEGVMIDAYFNNPQILPTRFNEFHGDGAFDRLRTAMASGDTATIDAILAPPSVEAKIGEVHSLLGGFFNWISDDDVERVISIVASVTNDADKRQVQAAVRSHLNEVNDHGQRGRLRSGCDL